MKKSLCILFFFLLSVANGQQLSAYLNHERIKLGEPVILNLSVQLPQDSKISFEPADNTLLARQTQKESQVSANEISLEINEKFKDTIKQKGSSPMWIGKYSLVSWDTGKIIIPAQQIVINDSTYFFNEVSLYVIPSTIGVKDELFDIEEGYAKLPEKLNFFQLMLKYWYVTGGGFLLLAGLIFLYFRRKNKTPKKPEKIMSLKDRTLFAINSLDEQKMWMEGKFKQHYTELSHIMRSYLSGRYDLNLLERTTFETRALLIQKGLPSDTVETFMTILKQADMVKFANSTTDELNVLKVSMLAKQIVAETSPLEVENEEITNRLN